MKKLACGIDEVGRGALAGPLVVASVIFKDYKKIKSKIKNDYLKSKTNDENMNFVYALSKLLKITLIKCGNIEKSRKLTISARFFVMTSSKSKLF